MDGYNSTSPQARRRFLDGHSQGSPGSGGDDWISRITEAERSAELTEADLFEARGALLEAQAQPPEMAHERDLDPDARHRYVAVFEAESRWRRCIEADDAARSRRDRLLAGYDQIAQPMSSWALDEDW